MDNPWKTLNTREIYKNEWIRLREDQVVTPSGQNGIYGVVEAHPAVAIVPLTNDLETYLVGQFRYTLNCWSWEVPEGGGAEGETILQTAKRELVEETGLTASKWDYLDSLYTSNSFTDEIGHVFLARDLQTGIARPDSTERLKIIKVTFEEACRMAENFEIKDALATIALFRVRNLLRENGTL